MATLLHRWDEGNEGDGVLDDTEPVTGQRNEQIPTILSLEEPGSRIWLPYLELADKYDRDLVHNWRDDMDSLLIFAALFFASVTAFVIESYKSLIQDTGDVTVSVLLQISQQLANNTQAPAIVPKFQAQSRDVAVNVFWFLSLAFSLTCALAAVLVRQWARQYLRYPRSFSSTSERARARQFLFENMQWWKMDIIVETIPALLHVSLLLFFIGLLLFLHQINSTLALYMLCFSTFGALAYSFLTTAPLAFPGCPYKTPFSGIFGLFLQPLFYAVWKCITSICGVVVLSASTCTRLWIPSFDNANVGERWAVTQLGNLRALLQILVRGILAARLVLRTSRGELLSFTASLWTSGIVRLQRTSEILMIRRQIFRNELTTRDSDALRWVMEFSKQDVDLLAIVESAPKFVRPYDSIAENRVIRSVIWNSGIISRAVKFLDSYLGHGHGRMNLNIRDPVVVTCLETIISLTQCSEDILGSSNEFALSVDLGTCDQAASSTLMFPSSFSRHHGLSQLYGCVLSNLIQLLVFKLEKLAESGISALRQEYGATQYCIMSLITSFESLLILDEPQVDPAYRSLPDSLPLSTKELYNWTSMFKSEWAILCLKFLFPSHALTTRQRWTIVANMSYILPHLGRFPRSTRESQSTIFTFIDNLGMVPDESRSVAQDHPAKNLRESYWKTLFGNSGRLFHYLYKFDRPNIHIHFIQNVNVCRTAEVIISGSVLGPQYRVDIQFDDYCKILTLFFSALREEREMHSDDSPDYLPDDDKFLNLQANVIRTFISCRRVNVDEFWDFPFVVDSQHLRITQTLLALSRRHSRFSHWGDFVMRTAEKFGYISQIDPLYNFHAELQFYDLPVNSWPFWPDLSSMIS